MKSWPLVESLSLRYIITFPHKMLKVTVLKDWIQLKKKTNLPFIQKKTQFIQNRISFFLVKFALCPHRNASITACIMFIKTNLFWMNHALLMKKIYLLKDISAVLLVLRRFRLDDARKVWNGCMWKLDCTRYSLFTGHNCRSSKSFVHFDQSRIPCECYLPDWETIIQEIYTALWQ